MNRELQNIFAIKRYAIHDGPQIRTTVFLKGCPLSCWWCHNPEGMSPDIDIVADYSGCIGCAECVRGCEGGALSQQDKRIVKQDDHCVKCFGCVEICPAMVYSTTGWTTSVQSVMDEIRKDLPFYDQSGGGVTFSGGEPLMQPDFLLELLEECGRLDIHRTVDTSCFATKETVQRVAEKTDLFLIDLKHMDNSSHRTCTGVDNTIILENIRLLAGMAKPMRIRIPLIPTINDGEDNMHQSAQFISSLSPDIEVDLLEYHNSATAKYKKMGKIYPAAQIPPKDSAVTEQSKNILESYGITTAIGG